MLRQIVNKEITSQCTKNITTTIIKQVIDHLQMPHIIWFQPLECDNVWIICNTVSHLNWLSFAFQNIIPFLKKLQMGIFLNCHDIKKKGYLDAFISRLQDRAVVHWANCLCLFGQDNSVHLCKGTLISKLFLSRFFFFFCQSILSQSQWEHTCLFGGQLR